MLQHCTRRKFDVNVQLSELITGQPCQTLMRAINNGNISICRRPAQDHDFWLNSMLSMQYEGFTASSQSAIRSSARVERAHLHLASNSKSVAAKVATAGFQSNASHCCRLANYIWCHSLPCTTKMQPASNHDYEICFFSVAQAWQRHLE